MSNNPHIPVLLHETIEALELRDNDVVVDATIGGAGHLTAISRELGALGTIVGIDADASACERGKTALHDAKPTVHIVNDNFRHVERILDNCGLPRITKAVFDLGWSGYQLTDEKGFSFLNNEPLQMTYASDVQALTAGDVLNTLNEEQLTDIISAYGEERFARSIARGIVSYRQEEGLLSYTQDLVGIIKRSTPVWYHHRRTHPATKTFQALRIAVNDEFDALREGLSGALSRLSKGGRIAVISFHSLEDRIVKHLFKDAVLSGYGLLLTKTPVTASHVELLQNPRARSAKLRVYESLAPYAQTPVDTRPHHAYV